MKRGLLSALLILLLPLAGCGGGGEGEEALPLSRLISAQMEAELVCHLEEEVRTYTLSCDWTPQEAQVEVLAPAELEGLAARWDGESLSLRYQDLVLDLGSLAGTDLGPAAVLPSMAAAIREGYPLERSREDLGETPCLRVAYETEEGRTLYVIWFTETSVPLRCEVERDGVLLYEVSVTAFSGTEEGEQNNALQPETDLGGN